MRGAPVINPKHRQAPRSLARPEPGFYLRRLVKGGPEVPCAITHGPTRDPETKQPLDRSWHWCAYECGRLVSASPAVTDAVWRIHESGTRITAEEYAVLIKQAAWDRRHDPAAPLANPREAINLRTMPLAF